MATPFPSHTIGSRMWTDADDALNGSLVHRGYESQKVTGPNYIQPLDFSDGVGCETGMKAHV
ncbi:hypothetical protein GGR51DRAFT_560856 [Nemania sp. FL0031]|nr:hypothetical protein GGR51DRAFT_560856 [Nemania sp. FL0031]